MKNYFLVKAGEEVDLVGNDGRTGFLRFQSPVGDTFDLPVSGPQLELVLSNVFGKPAAAPAPRRKPPLEARGQVVHEPLDEDPDMGFDEDDLFEEEEEPLVLRPPPAAFADAEEPL
jgi:hypothetical protein